MNVSRYNVVTLVNGVCRINIPLNNSVRNKV